jgi:hypothetical protein
MAGVDGAEVANALEIPDGELTPATFARMAGAAATGAGGDGVGESAPRMSSSSASGMVNSVRAKSVALGGNGAPSETLRRNPGGADEGRQGSCLSVPPSFDRFVVSGDEPGSATTGPRAPDDAPFFSLLDPLSALVRRLRELSLLLHGSTSSMKYLVPEASRYGFVEGSCVHGASTQGTHDEKV